MADKTPPSAPAAPQPGDIILAHPGETLETVLAAARLASPIVTGRDGAQYL